SAAAARDGVPTLLAWALLPAPGMVRPGPVALLRALPLPPTATDDDVLHAVVDPDAERWGEVDVDRPGTAAGRAWALRWRPVVPGADGSREVHEQRAVLWPVREHGVLLALTCYALDLLDGAEVAEPLLELASGLRWAAP
ncbi:hypothetical protein, partial [Blastococcus sp. TF02A-35]|uniref:hypothetical protein n=1 Tax=Blastococcus sp. TF02A-35 TaxID=2559612 RepID=UPI001431BF5D